MSRADGDTPGARFWLSSAQPQHTERWAASGGGCWCHPWVTWVAFTDLRGIWTALRSFAFNAEGDGRVWFVLQQGKCKRGLKTRC